MLARLPWSPKEDVIPLEPWRVKLRSKLGIWEHAQAKKIAARSVKRLNKDRRRHLIESVAAIIRASREQGAASHFTFEASCRHGLRAGLCLQGWPWPDADAAAADVVAAALIRVGAQRPTWKEGQPEWTQDGALPIERFYCIRCRVKLPEGHFKFCSKICSNGYHADRGNAQMAAERLAAGDTTGVVLGGRR